MSDAATTTAPEAAASPFPAACRAFLEVGQVRLRGLRVAGPAGAAGRLCFSSDGRWLLLAGKGGAALWDVARGAALWPAGGGAASAPAVSPGAARAAWATDDATITVRGLPRDGQAQDTFVVPSEAERVVAQAFSVDGRLLVTLGAGGQLKGLAFERGEVAWASRCEGLGEVAQAALARDARVAAAVAADGTCALIYPQTGTCLLRLGEPGAVRSVTLSADGQLLLAGTRDGARLWDAASGALLRRLPGADSDVVALEPRLGSTGGRALGARRDGKLVLWDTAGGHALERLDLGAFVARVHDAAFAPDGRTFVVAADTRRAVTPGASGREAVLLRFEPRP